MSNKAPIAYAPITGTPADYNISDDKKTIRVRFPLGGMTADEFESASKMALFYVIKTSGVKKDDGIVGNCNKTTSKNRIILTITVDPTGKRTLEDVKNFIESIEQKCVKSDSGTPNPGSGTPKPDSGTPKPGGGTPKPGSGTPKPGSGSAPKDPKEITQDVWGGIFSKMKADGVSGSDTAEQTFWDAYNAAKGNKS